jgi:hypothetical protein
VMLVHHMLRPDMWKVRELSKWYRTWSRLRAAVLVADHSSCSVQQVIEAIAEALLIAYLPGKQANTYRH